MEEFEETKQGRPKLKSELATNGLYKSQWARIKRDADTLGVPAASYLRNIVTFYYELADHVEAEQAERAELAKTEQVSDSEAKWTQPDLFATLPTQLTKKE